MALMYCKKCGRMVQSYDDESKGHCDCCNSAIYRVPTEFLISDSVPIIKSDLKQQFIDEYIKTSPEFDQYLFEHKDEILAKQSAEFNAKMEHGKAVLEEGSRTPKCTYCGSTNIRKIGLLNRAISTELWGLGSKKIGKQFHCNHCGTDF